MGAFQAKTNQIGDGGVLKVRLLKDDAALSYRSVISLWQQDENFRDFYIGFLSSIEYIAYRWETPPLSLETIYQPFEFVLIESPELNIPLDADAFSDYFNDALSQKDITVFPNLAKDAWLVVPCPKVSVDVYSHLAVFSKQAPVYQNHALWQRVGQVVEAHLDTTPRWLNTAGGGVAWLHVRLDSRPKYYCYGPYRSVSYW